MVNNNKYSEYFDIDEEYFPQVNDFAIAAASPDFWMRTYPHSTFIEMLKNMERVLARQEKRSLWIEGAYGTGKSQCAYALKKILEVPEEELRAYWDKYEQLRKKTDLLEKLIGHKQKGILTAHRYASGMISSPRDLFFAVQETLKASASGGEDMKTDPIKPIMTMIQRVKWAAKIKSGRSFNDFFADRILQMASEPTPVAAIERLCASVDADVSGISAAVLKDFFVCANTPEASAVLHWIRRHPRVAAMVAGLKGDDFDEALACIDIPTAGPLEAGTAPPSGAFDVAITARCLSPLAHGADTKAGNATLFRRCQVLSTTGAMLSLPFYAGNALRGQLRDLLADHLVSALGLTPRRDQPPLNLWFFHTLYAGGVLEEQSHVIDKINAELGRGGVLRTDGLRRFRQMLPALSLLGCAIGNRVLPGRICVGDLRPRCQEWGTGPTPAAELMEWTFLTRRDDHEGRGDDDDHHGMIATTECLKAGTELIGGIDIDTHADEMERSALGCALVSLHHRGRLGAENRRGIGRVEFSIDAGAEFLPDERPYDAWLAENRTEILEYLTAIGAINARD